MIITEKSPNPCPQCGATGKFGNIGVYNNALRRGCNACNFSDSKALPKLNKQILYLDQFFFSKAFRESHDDLVAGTRRINDLAFRQQLISPWSQLHELESNLWRSDQKDDLLAFIKATARGREFSQIYRIQSFQLQRAFFDFIEGNSQRPIDLSEAFSEKINNWDNYYWIEVGGFEGDPEKIRESRRHTAEALVVLLDKWQESDTSFEDDFKEEAKGYAEVLVQQYVEASQKLLEGDIDGHFSSPVSSGLIESLVQHECNSVSIEERTERVREFIFSDHFRSVPNIDCLASTTNPISVN